MTTKHIKIGMMNTNYVGYKYTSLVSEYKATVKEVELLLEEELNKDEILSMQHMLLQMRQMKEAINVFVLSDKEDISLDELLVKKTGKRLEELQAEDYVPDELRYESVDIINSPYVTYSGKRLMKMNSIKLDLLMEAYENNDLFACIVALEHLRSIGECFEVFVADESIDLGETAAMAIQNSMDMSWGELRKISEEERIANKVKESRANQIKSAANFIKGLFR